MGRLPINNDLTRGPWTKEEDQKLIDYVHKHGLGSWQLLPQKAGLNRCGKSCRLRWTNYLRPDIKRGNFSHEEEQTIINLHSILGNKWATIATRLPGRTDNEIKNYWNTQLKKRLIRSGIDPNTHQPIINQDYNHLNLLLNIPPMFPNPDFNSQMMRNPLENLAKIQILSNILQVLNVNPVPTLLNGSSQFLNQFDGQLHGILGNVQMSPMVSSLEHFNQISSDSQPNLSNSEMMFRDETRDSDNNKVVIGSNSNANSDYTLPALVPAAPEISSFGLEDANLRTADIPNYNELMEVCNDSVTGWGTVVDDEASSSFWKDIFD